MCHANSNQSKVGHSRFQCKEQYYQATVLNLKTPILFWLISAHVNLWKLKN